MEGMEGMNSTTKEKPAAVDMRAVMPETAKWVTAKRLEYGADHVNACIKAALAGTPGRFYAMEAGRTLGTPFPASHVMAEYQNIAIATGCPFAGFIAEPVDNCK